MTIEKVISDKVLSERGRAAIIKAVKTEGAKLRNIGDIHQPDAEKGGSAFVAIRKIEEGFEGKLTTRTRGGWKQQFWGATVQHAPAKPPSKAEIKSALEKGLRKDPLAAQMMDSGHLVVMAG